jgi:sec-independent protein translocase protein TatA
MGFVKGIGLPELLIILTIVLLLFGSTRLPRLASSMGKAIKEFRKATDDGKPKKGTSKRPRSKATPPR